MAIEPTLNQRPTPARRLGRAGAAMLLCACAGASGARADLMVREKITGGDGKPLAERTWRFAADKARMDEGSAGMLLDAAQGVGWIWGFEAGRCERLPVPGLGAGGGVAEMTRSERREVDAFFAELADVGATVVPRGESKTFAGVAAQRYDVVRDGATVQERWHAADVEATDFDAIVQTVMQSEKLSVLLGTEEGQIARATVGFGYPVRVKDLRSGNLVEAVEIGRGAQPASAFTPPAACAGN